MPATTTASETTLTPLQLQVLGYLADGASMVDITGVTQVHRNTISNWRNHNPAFARELLNATRNRALEFRDRAETLVPKAIRVLDAILDNDRVSSRRFASALPSRSSKWRNLFSLANPPKASKLGKKSKPLQSPYPKILKSCTMLHNRPSVWPSNPAATPPAPAVPASNSNVAAP